ncbi:unnamed protein product [Bemisia tabaci]|uniref:FMP27/BLTP2/Hobbit GFWDK motif-containing RBG unit domain-containing protein n=1 Tax=Bemisia tabaci TaxID=7038 RepID=A0A9P0EXG0_BEMTA|nr:unnamed protein product [Bemisia tabaci]
MDGVLIFSFLVLLSYYVVTRLFPKLFGWIIRKRYNIDARIGRIGLPYPNLQNIVISKNGFTIHIDKINFRSSFISSEVTKLICLVVHDVRINKDVVYQNLDEETESQDFGTDVSFHDKKIPPSIIILAQFLSVHIRTITAALFRPESPEWLIHATANDVHLDVSIVRSARTLLANLTTTSASAKLFRDAPPLSALPFNKPRPATCLAELSVALTAESTVMAQGPFSVEKLYVGLEHTKAIFNEGFYSFAQERKQQQKGSTGTSVKNDVNKRLGKPSSAPPHDQSGLEKLAKFSPIIPKSFILSLQNGVLTGMKGSMETELSASLRLLHIETKFSLIPPKKSKIPSMLPFVSLSVAVDALHCRGRYDKILELRKLSIETKLEDRELSLLFSLNTLLIVYNHKDIHTWLTTDLLRSTSLKLKNSEMMDSSSVVERHSWLRGVSIDCTAEMWNVMSFLKFSRSSNANPVIGFSKSKFTLSCDPVSSDSSPDDSARYMLESLPLNLSKRCWNSELLVETLWFSLKYSTDFSSGPLKKYHLWGTPLFLGVALIKVKGRLPPNTPKINAMLDTFRFEWSPPLAAIIILITKCVSDYQLTNPSKIIPREKTQKEKHLPTLFVVGVTVTNFNGFLIADKKVCIMARVDSITFESGTTKQNFALSGARLVSMCPTQAQFICHRYHDVKSAFGNIKLARLEWKGSSNQFTVEFLEEMEAHWSPNLHLKFLTLVEEFLDFSNNLVSETFASNFTHAADDDSKKQWNVQVRVKAKMKIGLILSKEHHLHLTSGNVTYRRSGDQINIETTQFDIAVDGCDIFMVENLQVTKIHDSEVVKVERANCEGFHLPWNNTWGIAIRSLKAIFPHEHNFASAVQNELFSIIKWLKLIHKKPAPKDELSPLPCDLIIKIKEFMFEMSDDPFEVHLRDNYELLEDEYKESLKRQKMLEAKLAKYFEAHVLMPANKVEELYNNLNKLNAQIYIQRSKQMKTQLPVRTRLFAWLMTDLEIIILADPSLHGPENVVKIMTEIDTDTPWPAEGVEFTTLWCRSIAVSCHEWKFQLRDFPQPWLDIKQLHLWGCLVGAEQLASERARRGVMIELGDPYGEVTIERSMTSLKFYHDFNCDVEHYSYAFGPCWEPVIAQCNLCLEKIFSPSRDPSPPLPWWDKMRLLYHGRLTMVIRQLTVLLHASLDPYNTMEEMEVTWTYVAMDWTNAKFIFKGDFDVFVRTASKYDDCRLLHLPNLKLNIKLTWRCVGDPNDHHSVMPCAPDKLPEYSSNQEHDSFRSFRSQNLNVSLSFETKPNPNSQNELDCPIALLYGSTFRWFENLKLILSGVTRPTRRGTIFSQVVRPRKLPLSRHYKRIHLSFGLHCFQIHYWMSFSMQRGLEIQGQRISYSSEYMLNLVPVEDGLKHRPRPVWAIMYMNCELNDAEVWLKSALKQENGKELVSFRQPVEKCYCLSVGKVCYGRETTVPNNCSSNNEDTPTHRLVVYHLRGAWTTSNRDVAFALFDSFMKTKQIKKNLSTEALKVFRSTDGNTPHKSRTRGMEGQVTPPLTATATSNSIQTSNAVQAAPSPMTKLQSGHAANMLQQLIAEADKKSVVFSNDLSAQTKEQNLQGLAACHEDDVVHKNWSISLVNSQVLLKGCETKGYVILSAAKAEILQRTHRPVWKDRTLVSKVTWVGSLECMQYYATVSAGESDSLTENIMWLSVENIQEENPTVIVDLPDVPDLVGSGKSVGGVVSETVGATSDQNEDAPLQLQRIVSRCKCEFFYAGYGELSIDPSTLKEVPPYPPEESSIPWEHVDHGVDSFTLMHHDLDVCTNSLQYAMILDIVNNLLLYVEPRRKEAYERLQRMRFQLQLHSVEDQRRPIQQLQNDVRGLVAKLRRLEKETYLVQRAMLEEPGNEELIQDIEDLEASVFECKEQLSVSSEELDMMLSCHKEKQLTANQKLATLQGDKAVTTARVNEICFKHAQWRLTQTDGQLGIADLVLSNFLYTKKTKSDDSVEHLLELGYVRMTNLLPNQIYKEVIVPTEIQSNMPVDRKKTIRVFCREKAPVGGISVKEHFEINVVPLTIGLTKKFFNTMLKFCFPEKDPENIENDVPETDIDSGTNKKIKGTTNTNKKGKDSNFYVPIEQKDDVEKMKERAEKNKLFIYIKIPEVPVRVSFKGNKEKNLKDIRDFSLVIPTLEYHNVTWTWLDLLLAMKNDSRRVILSQAITQKLRLKRNVNATDDGTSPQEEDKARMLFGDRLMPETSLNKKGFFKFQK